MPLLRVNANGQRSLAAPAYLGDDNQPIFPVRASTTDWLRVDWTGALQGAAIASSEWTASSCTVGNPAQVGGLVSALVAVTDQPGIVTNRIELDDGRVYSEVIELLPFGDSVPAGDGSVMLPVPIANTNISAEPDGIGATASVWIQRLLDVDIYAWGAVPGGDADDNAAAIAKAVARANSIGGVLCARMRPGTYEVSANVPGLTTAAGIDIEGSVLVATDPLQTGAFLSFGRLVTGGVQSPVLRGISVRRGTIADWTDSTQIGLRLRCVQNTVGGSVALVDGFTIGLRLQGESDGTTTADCVHNHITIGRLWRCQHALSLHSASPINGGAPNNNHFYGGDVTAQTGINTSLDRYGWSFTRDGSGYANHNNNIWDSPSFQHARPGGGVAYCVYSAVNPQQNLIKGAARAEWSAPSVMRGSLTLAGGGENKAEIGYATSYKRDELTDVVDGAATKASWRTRNARYSVTALDAMRPVMVVPDLRGELFQDWRDGPISYGFDRLHVAYTTAPAGGVGTATIATCVLRNDQRSSLSAGQGIVPNADSITIGAARGIGIMVDCAEAKWFYPVATQANGVRSYRWSVRCFDASGVLLGPDDRVLVEHPSVACGWNLTSLCWQISANQTDANQAGRVCFCLPETAKFAQFMLLYPGSDIADLQSFAIYTPEPYPVRAFHGVSGGTRELVGTVAWDPVNLPTGSQTSKTMTLAGVAKYDHVSARLGASIGNMMLTAYVQGNDTPAAVLFNNTGGDVNHPSDTLLFTVTKARVP